MDAIRLATLLQGVDDDRRRGVDVGERLCEACVDVVSVAGAGIMLMSEGQHRGTADAMVSRTLSAEALA